MILQNFQYAKIGYDVFLLYKKSYILYKCLDTAYVA